MERRRFLKLVGGGILLPAVAATSGCATTYPAAAISAWQAAGQGFDPRRDPRRWILSYALLAPHSHNLQSWLVDLREPDQIVLRCDPSRLLPETDPYFRQIMMSHGTFIELIDMAARARGLRAEIALFPEGSFAPDKIDHRPVARIRLVPAPGVAQEPLFAQVLRRRTNRNAYDLSRAVPAFAWQAMKTAIGAADVRFGFVDSLDPASLAQHRAIANEAWRIELTTPRTVMESYKVLRVGAEEIARHRDGISLMSPMVVWMDRLGIFDRSQAPAAESFATTSQLKDFAAKIQSTPSFFWMVTPGNDRVTQVNAGRTYVRVQLAATASDVAMQPLQQALQEYAEQSGPHAGIRRTIGVNSSAETIQMWARIGYAPAVQPAPRRALNELIQS